MNQFENDRIGRREVRKKKRINTFLNISIGIVAVIIVFISGTLFFGLGGNDEAAPNNNNDNDTAEENNEGAGGINENTNISDDETEQNNDADNELDGNLGDTVNDANNNNENNGNESNNNNQNNDSNDENESNENNSNNEESGPADEDEWGPIGTAQEEPFELTQEKFSRDHVNWEEMERALEYATGISQSEMTVWRIENAGGENTVVGTVSDDENTSTPYQVELSWVEGEGWEPASMEQLSSNPYGG
ncbi:YrrS family protein [Salisediminibacterium halotolerans]|uniref:DUF1510 domain-containing protein n=1 Tax=Salisediminibacterium halotolerans TaxID=517425 RepID=A0A1H9V9K5_9BACI|nr:YrrS family protein [Salisediminibacterium haloalkalitolerans]SES18382.1 Protein of unknown function [Salisediminibacterium haloalkalitolerans]